MHTHISVYKCIYRNLFLLKESKGSSYNQSESLAKSEYFNNFGSKTNIFPNCKRLQHNEIVHCYSNIKL